MTKPNEMKMDKKGGKKKPLQQNFQRHYCKGVTIDHLCVQGHCYKDETIKHSCAQGCCYIDTTMKK